MRACEVLLLAQVALALVVFALSLPLHAFLLGGLGALVGGALALGAVAALRRGATLSAVVRAALAGIAAVFGVYLFLVSCHWNARSHKQNRICLVCCCGLSS